MPLIHNIEVKTEDSHATRIDLAEKEIAPRAKT